MISSGTARMRLKSHNAVLLEDGNVRNAATVSLLWSSSLCPYRGHYSISRLQSGIIAVCPCFCIRPTAARSKLMKASPPSHSYIQCKVKHHYLQEKSNRIDRKSTRLNSSH